MRQGFDHSPGGGVRQLGVAVQGDDKADVRQVIRIAHLHQAGRVFRPGAVDQTVELLQFSPFTFPADVMLFRLAPGALAMQQEKTLAAMARIERFQACADDVQQIAVLRAGLGGAISEVGEQAEKQIGFFVGQIADLQLLHLVLDIVRTDQQHRHHHQGAAGIGNARLLEIHLGQGLGWQQPGEQIIDHLNRQLADRNQQEQHQPKAKSRQR